MRTYYPIEDSNDFEALQSQAEFGQHFKPLECPFDTLEDDVLLDMVTFH